MKSVGFFFEVVPDRCGGKGKNLITLARASFPVPPAFVVTFDAYRRFKEAGEMPGEIKRMISENFEKLRRESKGEGGTRFLGAAVRSSASAEDLDTASFAGLHDTYLYVGFEDTLLRRIVDCWNSLFSPRAVAYRQRMNISNNGLQMAVIVQKMVDARSAGILFTAQPSPGRKNVMVVESNWGCGETVVSGRVTPDHFVISRREPHHVLEKLAGEKTLLLEGGESGPVLKNVPPSRAKGFSLSDSEVSRLGKMGLQVENHFGHPQDIEWALSKGGEIFILQARPVTVWGNKE